MELTTAQKVLSGGTRLLKRESEMKKEKPDMQPRAAIAIDEPLRIHFELMKTNFPEIQAMHLIMQALEYTRLSGEEKMRVIYWVRDKVDSDINIAAKEKQND